MDKLSEIRLPVEKELAEYAGLFHSSLQHDNPVLQIALGHLSGRTGKMMRPVLLLLMAKLYGTVTPEVQHAAVSLELLHTASLVHDDIVDESDMRRGQRSVNALLNNKSAVLVGDYLLSTSLQHAAQTNDLHVVSLISWLGQTLSDGELLQLANVDRERISEDAYYEIIRKKTAALFAVCAQSGAYLAGADAGQVEKARLLGELIGICFQLRDDIFDYYDSAEIGKPTGNDMKEGKLTLPVIYAIGRTGTASEPFQLALKVKAGTATDEEIGRLVRFTKEHGGIEYAERVMEDYRDQALALLRSMNGSDDAVVRALEIYVDYVLARNI